MIAYEIQLWHVIRDKIRDKIQSKTKFSPRQNFVSVRDKFQSEKKFAGKEFSDFVSD